MFWEPVEDFFLVWDDGWFESVRLVQLWRYEKTELTAV